MGKKDLSLLREALEHLRRARRLMALSDDTTVCYFIDVLDRNTIDPLERMIGGEE